MRDYPLDAPITELLKADDYYSKLVSKTEEELSFLSKMTIAEAEIEAEQEFQSALKDSRQRKIEMSEIAARYKQMIDAVQQWSPPTKDHERLRTFMLEQLASSLEIDVHEVKQPQRLSGQEWLKTKIERKKHDIAYYLNEMTQEQNRISSRNQWLKDLHESVPIPAHLRKI